VNDITLKIKPKCYEGKQALAYTAQGYMLPCCWCDVKIAEPWFHENGFFEEQLKVENLDSVEDIFFSEAWQTFYRNIESNSEESCPICFYRCGTTDD